MRKPICNTIPAILVVALSIAAADQSRKTGLADRRPNVIHGFDEFVGFLVGAGDYHKHGNWMDGTEVKEQKGYSTHIITDRSVDFIERNKA